MFDLAVVFVAGFASVFALGFQSRNVNSGNYRWAAGTSFFVGLAQAPLWTIITTSNTGLLAGAVYGLSGACAITASMKIHERFISEKQNHVGRR